MSRMLRIASALMVLGLLPATSTHAAPIVAGQDLLPSVAVQMIDLYAGTPFNPGPGTLTVQMMSNGSFLLDRAMETNDAINFTIPSASFAGTLPSPLPPLSFGLFAGTPDLNASTGQITNVVQNSLDPGFNAGAASSFMSGNYTADTYFKLVLPDGTTIYSDPNAASVFTTNLTGLPPSVGTVFSSPDRINLFLETGASPDPGSDPIIGQSYDRTVTVTGGAVPEPSSVVLSLIGMAGVGIMARSVRARKPQ